MFMLFLRNVIHLFLFAIFIHNFPSFVVVRLLVLSMFMSLLQKKRPDLVRSSGVPIVVGLDANMYNKPGQHCSIFLGPGCTIMHGIGWSGPTFCPWNVCPVFAYPRLSGMNLKLQQRFWHFISF